jgi:hypothetical protein
LSEASFIRFPHDQAILRGAEGRFAGPPFLWLLSFGGAKESNSSAGTRPGMFAKPSNLIAYYPLSALSFSE